MPRYKDIDAILKKLPDDLPYKASVKRVLMQAPDADVVPREEIEKIFAEIENIFGKHMLWYRFTEAQYQLYVELKNKYTEEADGKQA